VVEPAVVPGGTSGNHNRSWVDSCSHDNRALEQNASVQDTGVVQDNNSVKALVALALYVREIRLELRDVHSVLMQGWPVGDD
jgi:hypothetical protein